MRELDYTARYKRDLRRELKGPFRNIILAELDTIVENLRTDTSLPARLRDHALSGDRAGQRDLHLRPDLVLIYSKSDANALLLRRLGSHSLLEL